MNRDFKGIWIPKEIWLDTKLNWSEKIILTEIDSLSSLGECFATNDYFADFMCLSKSHISRIISQLVEKKYIAIKLTYKTKTKQVEKRILTVVKMGGYTQECVEGIRKNADTPIRKNAEDNNTCINNTINSNVDLHNEICSIFNKNPNTYKFSDKRKKVLKTRLKDCGRENIIKSCKNLSKSEFHMGKNDRKWVAEPYWVLSSYEKCEEWANKKPDKPKLINYRTPDQFNRVDNRGESNPDFIKSLRDRIFNK